MKEFEGKRVLITGSAKGIGVGIAEVFAENGAELLLHYRTSPEEGEALRTAKDAAAKFGCVFAVTGPIDNISNGKQAVVLNNGHPLLQDITGSGCMTTTLVACCAAITKDMLVAAALGVVIMGQSAELAANFLEKKDGPGMFKVRLIDAIYHVTTKWNLVNLKPEEKVS